MALFFGIVGGWRLNEGIGFNRADVINTRSLRENGTNIQSSPGRFSPAARFVTSGGQLVNNSVGEILPRDKFSLACWVSLPSITGGTGITLLAQSGAATRQLLGIDVTTRKPRYSITTTAVIEGTAIGEAWSHIALAYDGSVPIYTTYQNGVIVGSHITAASFSTPNGVLIGSVIGGSIIVDVDEAYMWGRTLNEAEVMQLYKAGNAGISYPFTDGKSFL